MEWQTTATRMVASEAHIWYSTIRVKPMLRFWFGWTKESVRRVRLRHPTAIVNSLKGFPCEKATHLHDGRPDSGDRMFAHKPGRKPYDRCH